MNINRRCVESDLVIYVNINLVPMDGGHKSVAVGLCDYESLRPHHEPETIRASDSYMDPKRSMLNTKVERQGALVDRHMNVFHIETALNNRIYAGATDFPSKNEDAFTACNVAHSLHFHLGWLGFREFFRTAIRPATHLGT